MLREEEKKEKKKKKERKKGEGEEEFVRGRTRRALGIEVDTTVECALRG